MVQRQNTPKIETCNWKSEKCEKLVWKRWDFRIDYQVPKHRVLCTAFLSVWFMHLIQCCEPLKVKDSGDTLRMVLNADLIFKCHDCHLVLILIWLDLIWFSFLTYLVGGWAGRQGQVEWRMVQVAPKLQQQQIVFATQPQDESRGDVETGGFFGTNLSSFVAYGSLEVCFVSIIQGKHSLRE